MSRHNRNPSREYLSLVNLIQEFVQEHGRNDTIRAVADALEEPLKESFKASYGVDGTTDGAPCIGRLISGAGQCTHGHRRGDENEPPHSPPHKDHADLWLSDGEPKAYAMHLYDVGEEELDDILEFARSWGLKVRIDPSSWYFPNRTVHIVFLAPERLRE